jgi:hypothetical protein
LRRGSGRQRDGWIRSASLSHHSFLWTGSVLGDSLLFRNLVTAHSSFPARSRFRLRGRWRLLLVLRRRRARRLLYCRLRQLTRIFRLCARLGSGRRRSLLLGWFCAIGLRWLCRGSLLLRRLAPACAKPSRYEDCEHDGQSYFHREYRLIEQFLSILAFQLVVCAMTFGTVT